MEIFSLGAATLNEAKEEAAVEALKIFGVHNAAEAAVLNECVRVRRRKVYLPMTSVASPFLFCPSKHGAWVFSQFPVVDDEEMTGKQITRSDDTKNLLLIDTPEELTEEEVFERLLNVEPAVEGVSLEQIDVTVAEVNPSNKCNFVVGNDNFSISLFAEDGKIMSTKKGSLVDLSAGSVIRGLKCSYQLMYPSLNVYLKAESCSEVLKPGKTSNVLTSCGAVVLMYDHEANVRDLNVLLTRQCDSKRFIAKANHLKTYLNSIDPTTTIKRQNGRQRVFSPTSWMKEIHSWTKKEV